jgi:hypothetical protein
MDLHPATPLIAELGSPSEEVVFDEWRSEAEVPGKWLTTVGGLGAVTCVNAPSAVSALAEINGVNDGLSRMRTLNAGSVRGGGAQGVGGGG